MGAHQFSYHFSDQKLELVGSGSEINNSGSGYKTLTEMSNKFKSSMGKNLSYLVTVSQDLESSTKFGKFGKFNKIRNRPRVSLIGTEEAG